MTGSTLTLTETDKFFFDESAADLAVRFIEKYCHHYEGKHAGKPFLLLDWEKTLTRTLFGWKRKADGLRRFRELYLLSAKGSGKTPLLAGIGLKMLLKDDEPGAHIISMASSFEQANLSFDCAKKFIGGSSALSSNAEVKQYLNDRRHQRNADNDSDGLCNAMELPFDRSRRLSGTSAPRQCDI